MKLGEIGVFMGGGTPSKKHPEYYGGNIPWVSTVALNGSFIDEADAIQMITEEGLAHSATKVIPAGSLMIGTRVGVGKVAINRVPICACQDIVSICGIDGSAWDKEYLAYFVQSKASFLASQKRGATISGIKSDVLKNLQVPAVAFDAQKKVVASLNKAKSLIESGQKELSLLDELVKSRFVEMFGDPENNVHGFCLSKLGDVLSVQPSNGLYKPQKDYVTDGSGCPIVRIDSFRAEGPDFKRLKRLTCTDVELMRYGLVENDIVINRVNSVGCMGKTMLVANIPELVVFESNMMRLHAAETIMLPAFLCAQMTNAYSKNYFESNAKRAIGQASINQTDVKNLPVLVPPIELQDEYLSFVRQVDKLKFGYSWCIKLQKGTQPLSISITHLSSIMERATLPSPAMPAQISDRSSSELRNQSSISSDT